MTYVKLHAILLHRILFLSVVATEASVVVAEWQRAPGYADDGSVHMVESRSVLVVVLTAGTGTKGRQPHPGAARHSISESRGTVWMKPVKLKDKESFLSKTSQ